MLHTSHIQRIFLIELKKCELCSRYFYFDWNIIVNMRGGSAPAEELHGEKD